MVILNAIYHCYRIWFWIETNDNIMTFINTGLTVYYIIVNIHRVVVTRERFFFLRVTAR